MARWKSNSPEQTGLVAREILQLAGTARHFAFHGEMGAGKTTLIKAMCRYLGVGEGQMSSPTFSIVNEYSAGEGLVYHFDLYRVNSMDEMYDIGYEEYFYSGEYVLVEWAEKFPSLISDEFIKVNISVSEEGTREIEIKS